MTTHIVGYNIRIQHGWKWVSCAIITVMIAHIYTDFALNNTFSECEFNDKVRYARHGYDDDIVWCHANRRAEIAVFFV